MQVIAILIIEAIALFYFIRQTEAGLKMFGLVNLMAVIMTGSVESDFLIGRSNTANLFFAISLQTVALIYYKYGHRVAARAVAHMIVALAIFLMLRYAAIELNVFNPWNPVVQAYKVVMESAIKFFVSSAVGFGVSAGVLVWVLEHFRYRTDRVRYLVGLGAGQIVDSVIFFVLAFWSNTAWLEFLLTGLAIKIGVHAVLTPVLLRFVVPQEFDTTTG